MTVDCFLCKTPVEEGASAGPFGRICEKCEHAFDRRMPRRRSLNQTNPSLVKYEKNCLKDPPFTVLVKYADGMIQKGPSPLKAVNKVK